MIDPGRADNGIICPTTPEGDIPHAHRAVAGPGDGPTSIVVQQRGISAVGVAFEHLKAFGVGEIPDSDGAAAGRSDGAPAVGTERHGADEAAVTFEHLEALAGARPMGWLHTL
jgi:hypothetical protein